MTSIKLTFNESKQIKRVLTTHVKAQAVTMATLGPVLSAYEINVNNICKAVNEATKSFPVNMPINIVLVIFFDKTFNVAIKGPSSSFLLKSFKNKNAINLADFWRVYIVKKHFSADFSIRELLSTLYSAKIKIIN